VTLTAPTPDTKSEILRVARRLIKTRSYLGFSFQDLADEIGIRKPSLYHHFASKEALGVAVLRHTTEAFTQWSARTPPDPLGKLQAYFKMYRHELEAAHAVCLAGALATGWDCIDDSLQAAVRELRLVQIEWLETFSSALKPKSFGCSSAEWAQCIFATCQGALLSARMTGRPQDFDAAIAGLAPAAATASNKPRSSP
jgi:TetR/AcrR family transcriptional regulator, transcriptional repressor for nem operon